LIRRKQEKKMSASVYVGLDIGTTSIKVAAVTKQQGSVGTALLSLLSRVRPMYLVQSPSSLSEGQGSDEHGLSVRPAIMWNDNRTKSSLSEIKQRLESKAETVHLQFLRPFRQGSVGTALLSLLSRVRPMYLVQSPSSLSEGQGIRRKQEKKMSASVYVGLDIGTTSIKVAAVTKQLETCWNSSFKPFITSSPHVSGSISVQPF
jgi:sugar (pentulose or hexulose) kinase